MDVVEQGRRDRSAWPRWLRAVAVAAVVALGALILRQSHLLSADEPEAGRPTGAPTSREGPRGENTSQGISVVVRQGDHLERYEAGSGRRPLATLPEDLPDPTPFVHVPGRDGTGPLVAVDRSVLFRASAVRGNRVVRIGRANRVLAVSPEPGRLFVVQPSGGPSDGPRLAEVDARTGNNTDNQPFPGYDGTGSWRPADVVSSPGGGSALLLTREAGASRLELALAWDRLSVRFEGARPLARIGFTSELLGVAQTRIFTLDRSNTCVDGCNITVLSVSRDQLGTREVEPPSGWTFGSTVVGGSGGDPLVVVSRDGDPTNLALARLVAGARLGLLVAGSEGLDGSVTPVGGPEGEVVFAVPRPEGVRLSVWLPGSPSSALLLDLPALKTGAELVCACR